jgi:gamma-glutamyltranspeptidase/glutathione hydrolase
MSAFCAVVVWSLAHAAPAPATSAQGMAATPHPLATAAAIEMLQAGGNAVDAAVAATFVISVTNQMSAGIGGGGFVVVHMAANGEKTAEISALDFRETAPKAATRDMYLHPDGPQAGTVNADAALNGALSVAVPATVPGLVALHKKYGALPWRRLLRPAITAARDGIVLSAEFIDALTYRLDVLMRFPESKRVYHNAGAPWRVGDRFRQPDLARTLTAIAVNPQAITHGAIAQAIVDDVRAHGGVLTLDDLSSVTPRWRTPLCAPWRDLELCTMPPPSSGGVHVLQMLRLLDASGLDLRALGWHHPDALHWMIESMRTAFADRATHLGDPGFTAVPVSGLVAPSYIDARKREIGARARKSVDVKAGDAALLAKLSKASNDTSHLTVVDKQRNAVSLTFTVNYLFGSGMIAKGTGVLLNDEMDDFSAAPGAANQYGLVGGEANAVAPGKIPLSSMTPLIARRAGAFALSLGAPGGSTIITTVLQTLLAVETYGMDCQAAVAAPRIHHQWLPDLVRTEAYGLDVLTERELTARGHTLKTVPGWGNAMCIRQRMDGLLEGGADPRGDGVALGF